MFDDGPSGHHLFPIHTIFLGIIASFSLAEDEEK